MNVLMFVLRLLLLVYALGALGFIPVGLNALSNVKPSLDSKPVLYTSQVFSFLVIVFGWPVWFAQGIIQSRKH